MTFKPDGQGSALHITCIMNTLQDLNNNFIIDTFMELRTLGSMSFLIIMTLILMLSGTQIYAGESIKWKTFKEKNDLFTMKYPSNWFPSKPAGEEYPSLLEMDFSYTGGGRSDIASVSIIAHESVFTNVSDLMDSFAASLSSEFDIIQPVECDKYMVKGLQACSITSTYKQTDLPGNPTIKETDVVTIDELGVQYILIYGASKNLYDDFLPVAEEMIKSFNSGNILSTEDETALTTQESPELPPL